MFYDPHYLLFVFVPLLVITGLAQMLVHTTYSKYSRVANRQGVTGAEAARYILERAGIHDVQVEQVQGWLSDHYSPREKVLRLSPQNYGTPSISAVGIAAHEAGHAIQHAEKYAPLVLRNAAVPLASIGSGFGYLVIFIGLAMSGGYGALNVFTIAGLLLIAGVAVFQLINLPVEFDASRRALAVLPETGVLTVEETAAARKVLGAAALTYVAATLAAILELAYWAWRLGLLGGGRSRD